jgi:hypothetical protein
MEQQPSPGLRTFAALAFTFVLLSGVALLSYWWGTKSARLGQVPKPAIQNTSENGQSKAAAPVVETSNQSLSVTSPTPDQAVTSPFRVEGKSNFFEAHTAIRMKDANGKVMAQSFATASGWMDNLYPFATYVSYSKPPTATGTVEIYEPSAQDGSDINLISIPVKFADAPDKNWSKFSPKFENAVVNGVQQEIADELATNLNFIIDATECCGPTTKKKVLPQIMSNLQSTDLIYFSQDTEQVKKLRAGPDAQYLAKYILGISDKDFMVSYHVGAGGKVDDVFFSGTILNSR